MRKRFINLFLVAGIAMGAVSCKEEENEVEATDAEVVEPVAVEAVTYTIDTASSVLKWRGTKPTGEHIGTISIEDGELIAQDGTLEGGKVVIDMNSIEVLDEDMEEEDKTSLENHLKGTVEGKETDFFNVQKYPTATFEVTGTEEREGKVYLSGNLTLKDVTKNVEFPVNTKLSEDGETLILESEPFTIDRTNWGVNYGSKSVFDNLGDQFISDDMEIQIQVEATK